MAWRGEPHRPLAAVSSLAEIEAAAELALVPAVHDAVTVEVKVPHKTGVRGAGPECGAEKVAVYPVYNAVAIRVAKQPREPVHEVASSRAVTVAVQLPSPLVVHQAPPDGQGVAAVR